MNIFSSSLKTSPRFVLAILRGFTTWLLQTKNTLVQYLSLKPNRMPAFLLADIPPLQCLEATSQVSVVSFQLFEMSLEKNGRKKHIRSVSVIVRLMLVRLGVKLKIILWPDPEKLNNLLNIAEKAVTVSTPCQPCYRSYYYSSSIYIPGHLRRYLPIPSMFCL